MKQQPTVTLQLQNLSKAFGARGDIQAVDNINLEIYQGEFITLLGPSGCGKTTTLRLIAGFEFPTAGQVILDGAVINNVPPNKRPMSMVFQNYALFPHLSVFENIAYGLRIKWPKSEELNDTVEIAMQLMNLVGLGNRMPHQLSGGQQQRVALARALVMEPRVLLFDEPLSNLDAKLRAQMRTEIHRIHHQLGITSVYVTHDQAEALGLSDRVVVMHSGKVEQIGTPLEIYAEPASVFVADFVGRANFVESVVLSAANKQLRCDLWGQSVTLPSAGYAWHEFAPGEAAYLVIRPESVKFVREGAGIEVEGIVRRVEYLGSRVEYEIEVQGYPVAVSDYNPYVNELRMQGDLVTLYFPAEACHLLPIPAKAGEHHEPGA